MTRCPYLQNGESCPDHGSPAPHDAPLDFEKAEQEWRRLNAADLGASGYGLQYHGISWEEKDNLQRQARAYADAAAKTAKREERRATLAEMRDKLSTVSGSIYGLRDTIDWIDEQLEARDDHR